MIKISNNRYRALRQSDPDFTFSPNGITLVSRAAIEISHQCPGEHKWIIQQCIENGWIRPVAYMRDTEYTMELLQK